MMVKRQLDFEAFLADHPVFSLAELAAARGKPRDLDGARNQVKHHLRQGRVKSVARGLYAAVPPGLDAARFQPDPFLVAAAARPSGIFAYHAALELLGVAHSVWHECALHCERKRAPIRVGARRIVFLPTPRPLAREGLARLGTREVVRGERRLQVTGAERTLVEGLRHSHRVGGVEEHVESIRGVPALDFELLDRVLGAYGEGVLWAAVGWLVESSSSLWRPPSRFLEECRRRAPRTNRYLVRNERGGRLVPEWRLILPRQVPRGFEGIAPDG